MIYISELMMILWWSENILKIIKREKDQLITHKPVYCIKDSRIGGIKLILDIHSRQNIPDKRFTDMDMFNVANNFIMQWCNMQIRIRSLGNNVLHYL